MKLEDLELKLERSSEDGEKCVFLVVSGCALASYTEGEDEDGPCDPTGAHAVCKAELERWIAEDKEEEAKRPDWLMDGWEIREEDDGQRYLFEKVGGGSGYWEPKNKNKNAMLAGFYAMCAGIDTPKQKLTLPEGYESKLDEDGDLALFCGDEVIAWKGKCGVYRTSAKNKHISANIIWLQMLVEESEK